ncbi:acyltransferase family protein [Corynebacterium amycolatum]|uniref:acyltransferase family protein n=1 Tax=Corynebacterium amycolatum TaxID=43765 RepID=UPI003EE138F8
MPRPVKHPEQYVPALDGIRTIAVALVVLYHLAVPGFGGGLLGVAVFFTLSGYLITTNLVNSKLRHDTFRLKTFWFRRFRRLLPAVITTLLAVMFLTIAFRPEETAKTGWQALSALFYVNNWHTIAAGESYFDKFAGLGPLDHMWSLSIEEQFYLIWPLILVVLFATLRSRRRIVAATIALTVASFGLMWWLASVGAEHTRIYEGTDTRAGGLLLGAALAIALAFRRHEGATANLNRGLSGMLGLIGLASIIALATQTSQRGIFLYHGGLILATIASVLVIMAGLNRESLFSRILGATPMRWLGERSYGIYLWHMPIIAFLPRQWLPGTTENAVVAWSSSALVFIGSTTLAAISWVILEDPIRRHGIIQPLRERLQARRNRRAGKNGANEFVPRYMGAIPATSTITMLALILIGTPLLLSGTDNRGEGAGNSAVAMELPKDASKKSKAETKSTSDTEASDGTRMRCTTVVHVGDSTSIGLFDTNQVPEGAATGFQTYLDHGAKEVTDSVFGARATNQGFQDYPSAVQSVSELLSMGQDSDTCWVIATGVNDAANYAALPDYGYEQNPEEIKANIRTMLDLLEGQMVMWNTVGTYQPADSYYDNANMKLFNKLLKEVAKEYPNVAIWDWASEISEHNDWFIPGDGTHFLPKGNAERAKRFASALAHAFPEDGTGHKPAKKIVNS